MAFTKCYSISNGQWQWQWNAYDWYNLLKSTTMGLASGFVGGWVGGELGGRYTDGNLSFIDRISSKALTNNVSLFYEMKLNNFANTIGSIAGEAVHYAWGGNFRISLASDVGMAFTHDGQIVNDVSGGIGLVNLVDAIGSLNYVGFQYKNVHGGDEGLSRISYVNMGYLSGDDFGMKTSMDIINGKKSLLFDLEEEGHYGEAGEDTIHLNKKAITENTAEGLLFYTSTVVREGVLIDSGLVGKDRMTAYARELGATGIQKMVLDNLARNFGVDVYDGSSEYSKVANLIAYATETGDLSLFNWESGNDLWIKELGVDIRNQRNNVSRGKNGKRIADGMCNLTALTIALVSMPNNKDLRKVVSINDPVWFFNEERQIEDELEERRREMSSYLKSKYGVDERTFPSTLVELALASGSIEPVDYKKGQWFYKDGTEVSHSWDGKNNGNPTVDDVKKFYLYLKNKIMKPGDQLIAGGRFNFVYEDNNMKKRLQHMVYIKEITENGLIIVDPYGGYIKYAMQNYGNFKYNNIEDNLYRRNDKTNEFTREFTSYYFLPWDRVYEHEVGRRVFLLLRPNMDIADNFSRQLWKKWFFGK
ncbi:hypothetical protein [Thermospira aquatica]|uniref:Uncharacterized protein n=1 Tax=Thermospira aquatica TaxID=2828656 RepID=A0AAX3BDJ4_9SPIR|nr:hypothetical protein [Thermospira aquatica]URA09901.1 hypothetical protein KDW03_10515 [Thermospira aquatica]